MAPESPELVFNFHVPFVEAAEFEGSEVDVPDSVVDLLEADILANAHDAHVHPGSVPADTAVGTDVTHLEAIRVLERRRPVRHRS